MMILARSSTLALLLAACGGGASTTPDAATSLADAAVSQADARPPTDAPPADGGSADASPADARPADASVPDAPPVPDAGITQLRATFAPVTAHGESRSQGHVLRITAPAEPTGTMSGAGGTLELGPP